MSSIRLEGSIVSADLLDAIGRGDKHSQDPKDFGLPAGTKVKDEIASAWAAAKAYWTAYETKVSSLKPGVTGTTETRNLFVQPLLSLLGYSPQLAEAETHQGRSYAISHRDHGRGGFPIHIIGPHHADPAISPEKSSLDVKVKGVARMSPHALVQEYLNLTEHLYALVCNGHKLRLLRDSSRLVKLSFLEFDFERMFTEELFADFALVYRLLHASRMPASQESAAESIIERYHQDALDSGSRIRDGLAAAVEKVIVELANGLLNHPENRELREAASSDSFPVSDLTREREFAGPFYEALLRLIYRILFLLVTEERGLIHLPGTDARRIAIYRDYYSVSRLRRLAESVRHVEHRHSDAWQSMLRCFRLFEPDGGGGPLGIAPLGGLFGDFRGGLLGRCMLDNRTLLGCLRKLSHFRHPDTRQLIRVNYSALDVEEFGSVYEGLLEYDPSVLGLSEGTWQFAFKQGDDRSNTGSHYTPDDLVQPLLKHSLDYLIADKLKEADKEAALLSLRVADIACGSGHILLAAARRIGTELAIVRTGEDQPSLPALRQAIRDAIRNCIYGVDLNPLAVELCKVALWLEAHVPGQPLNFLDHHIKCGNAIVGFVHQEELEKGVPDEAFKTLPDDDKDIAAEFRRKNKEERRDKRQAHLPMDPELESKLAQIREQWRRLSALPEHTPHEIEHKRDEFQKFTSGEDAMLLEQIAAIPIAQFYLEKSPENRQRLMTDAEFRAFHSGSRHPQGMATASAWAIARKKKFFHWFLQFPEIIQRGGFDCILGNPPYLGGTHLSGSYGHPFCEYVRWQYAPTGLSELVVFFLRRIHELLRKDGFTAFITILRAS